MHLPARILNAQGTQDRSSDLDAILAETANSYWLVEYAYSFDASRRAYNLQIP